MKNTFALYNIAVVYMYPNIVLREFSGYTETDTRVGRIVNDISNPNSRIDFRKDGLNTYN